MWRKTGALLTAGALLFLSTRPAAAESPPPSAPVPIAVYPKTRGLRFELQMPNTLRPVALCRGPCTAYLPPGRYRLFAHATDDTRAGSRAVKLEGPSVVYLEPKSRASHDTGLTFAIVGTALTVLSVIYLADTHDPVRSHDDMATLAVAGLVGGLIMAPIGWVLYGKSLRPAVDVQPLAR
jgi:hypothetical protein